MPFYEYQCKSCGHDLEAMQKINDPPLKKCPNCGKAQLQRLMSAPVFRLKGGGWYETDFKGDQDTKRNLADRPEADAAKEGTKDAVAEKDAAKDGSASGADGKGKEGNGKDAKGADGAGAKESTSKEAGSKQSGSKESASSREAMSKESASKDSASRDKAADRPAQKAQGSEKKAGAGKISHRSHTAAGRGKSAAKRPIKRPVHKATRRG